MSKHTGTIIDGEEIALVIAKAVLGMHPPDHVTTKEAMAELIKMDADAANGFRRAAYAVVKYLADMYGAGVIRITDLPDTARKQ